jgi:hypothetical protein
MKYINLTSHDINEVTTGITIPTSGVVVRCTTKTKQINTKKDIPIYRTSTTSVLGLPEPKADTIYIVSSLTLNAVHSNRKDVVAPGNLQRGQDGKPIGCMGFRTK